MNGGESGLVEQPIIEWLRGLGWKYVPASELQRMPGEAFEYSAFKDALRTLNPGEIISDDDVEKVRSRLEALTNNISGNREFFDWIKGEGSVVLQPGEKARTIRLIDYKNAMSNRFTVTNQFKYSGYRNVRVDIVLMVNGIPLVAIEAKSPTGGNDYTEAIRQLQRYHSDAPQFFKYLAFVCATDGVNFRYDWVSERHYFKWREPGYQDHVEGAVKGLLEPERFLDFISNFIIFHTDRREITKKIARYQQMQAANKIVERVLSGDQRTGLVWHTQGSGKTLTMLLAAWKLKKRPELENPTILVVVDRKELERQVSDDFFNVELPYTAKATSIRNLRKKLESGSREVIITTIQKFEGIEKVLTQRNVIVMVDEAHRTQYGYLASSMKKALPNAYIFGFTGTPIDKGPTGKSTFRTFCPRGEVYLDKYSTKQSIDDGSTVPIFYLGRLARYHVDEETLEKEFLRITEGLSPEEQDRVAMKSAKIKEILKSEERINKVAKDVAAHFKSHVDPLGFKAQFVAVDREACALYKEALDKHLPTDWSEVIYTPGANDSELLRKYHLPKEEQLKIARVDFQRRNEKPRILIVTDMLLTGFDAPIEQVMYLDKPMRDHKLLQAIARTNRPFPGKEGGIIADYVGIFDDLMKALNFQERDIEGVAYDYDKLREEFATTIKQTLGIFDGLTIDGSRATMFGAFKILEDDDKFRKFKENLSKLKRLFETLAPDEFLLDHKATCAWLVGIDQAHNKYLQREERALGEYEKKTKKLIREAVKAGQVGDIPVLQIDKQYLKKLEGLGYSPEQQTMDLQQAIWYQIRMNVGRNPVYETIGQRVKRILEALDGEALLAALKEIVGQILQIEKEREDLKLEPEEYALLQVAKQYSKISDQKGALFAKALCADAKPMLFDGWQDKKMVRQEVEERLFQSCFERFKGELDNRDILSMAETMVTYLSRFEAAT